MKCKYIENRGKGSVNSKFMHTTTMQIRELYRACQGPARAIATDMMKYYTNTIHYKKELHYEESIHKE